MLGPNEAIAGLDSPAMAMTLPRNPLGAGGGGTASSGGGGNGAFNWLQSKMNDLQIGGEKKAAERGAINRNATVFQVMVQGSLEYIQHQDKDPQTQNLYAILTPY